MNTLLSAPVAPLLDRLFAEADAAEQASAAATADLTEAEEERLLLSKTEYPAFYARFRDQPLAVSREAGWLLYLLARGAGARTVVEFGTSFGISTLHLAAALRDNGGGKVIGTEFEPSKLDRARRHLSEAGLIDLVELRLGDALTTLAADLPEAIDLLLLDGAKSLYIEILTLVAPRLRPGAFVVADNADYSPDYLALVRAPSSGYLTLPFSADVELSLKLG